MNKSEPAAKEWNPLPLDRVYHAATDRLIEPSSGARVHFRGEPGYSLLTPVSYNDQTMRYSCTLKTRPRGLTYEANIFADENSFWRFIRVIETPDPSPDATDSPNKTVSDEWGYPQSSNGVRYDLIPAGPLEAVAKVLHAGAIKHPNASWRSIPIEHHLNHALDHINKYRRGNPSEDHLVHALCRLFFAKDLYDSKRWGGAASPKIKDLQALAKMLLTAKPSDVQHHG